MANETRENEDGTRFYVCEGGELGRTESRGSKYLSSGVQNSTTWGWLSFTRKERHKIKIDLETKARNFSIRLFFRK